mmetsp:Transcript_37490/g.76310  ORF Transcript_37490/g.76310 Transcript_37490/m.76310 type:complete len:416 (+) Transcript_37490:268-1515(+)|eukprot:CAMPEP_0178528116 /NCGR_PEP_ID=MMETSP0696-20121128/31636_1 /TAXON_ID=265572 /ORGANISM="Extubocellulus spinifer, Strain CCMP396" /LENGTH=415 /DNA_ID=CAMNT_0020159759 /DNA_START=12 /DNA_END=1259 /DNA_ORIENTATION=+
MAHQKAGRRATPPHRNTVRPAIFEYSCRGYLHLEHKDEHKDGATDNPNNNLSSSTSSSKPGIGNDSPLQPLPYCRGIKSKLRKVRDLPPSTRDSSIMDFIDMVSVEPSHRGGQSDENRASAEAGSKGRATGSSTSTAVVGGKRPPIGPAPALPVGPDAADYGAPPDDIANDPTGSDLDRRKSGSVQILPPTSTDAQNNGSLSSSGEEGTADLYYSTLSCWGMTTVSVLVLTKPDGSKEVAAVAPENTLGISFRDEGDAKGGDATATLRVGPVEIAIGNKYEYEEDGDKERGADVATTEEEKIRNMDGSIKDGGAKKMHSRRRPESSTEDRNKQGNDTIGNDPFSDRLANTISRTAGSMADNAKTITNTQFPIRMYKSGERIAGEFGKTLQRTGKLAKDVFRMWSDDDDDDNDGGR